MNNTISKRKYDSVEEMTRDFSENYYERGTTHVRPSECLWSRMHRDGVNSIAANLWNNQWHLLNTGSGMCWLPSHGPTNRKLFSPKPPRNPRIDLNMNNTPKKQTPTASAGSLALGAGFELQSWTATLDKINHEQLAHVMGFIIQKLCTGKHEH